MGDQPTNPFGVVERAGNNQDLAMEASEAEHYQYFEEERVDVIDETTAVVPTGFGVLTGEKISHNMSPTAVGTIDRDQMNVFGTTSGFQVTEWGWPDIESLPPWVVNMAVDFFSGCFGVMLAETTAASVYVDPDRGVLDGRTGLKIYGHMSPVPFFNRPFDPQVNDVEGSLVTDLEQEYGSARYKSPFTYDPLEILSMVLKFGYDATTYSPDVYNGSYERMGRELEDALEMLQLGYTERQNIRRITEQVNLFRDFEAIEEPELKEDTLLAEEMTLSTDKTMMADRAATRTRGIGGTESVSGANVRIKSDSDTISTSAPPSAPSESESSFGGGGSTGGGGGSGGGGGGGSY